MAEIRLSKINIKTIFLFGTRTENGPTPKTQSLYNCLKFKIAPDLMTDLINFAIVERWRTAETRRLSSVSSDPMSSQNESFFAIFLPECNLDCELTVETDVDLLGDGRGVVGVGCLADEFCSEVFPLEAAVGHGVDHGAVAGELVGAVVDPSLPPPGNCRQWRTWYNNIKTHPNIAPKSIVWKFKYKN